MKYRRLGKTDLNVSVVGVGTWQFGGEWGKEFSQQEVNQILGRATELGINLIDTAECYGDHLSERLVGAAIKGNRDRWIIATKFGHRFHGNFDRTDHWTADEVRQQLEDSLRALSTDTVDLYQFHSGTDEALAQDDLWEMLQKQVQAGKVRFLGLSISSKQENLHQVQRAREIGISVIQLVYNRLERRPEERVLPACIEADLGVLARVPLASGLLSGKYAPGQQFTDATDVRSTMKPEKLATMLEEVEAIRHSEVPPDVPMASWALAWCLKHPAVTSVIPGNKSVSQLQMNAQAADLAADDHPQAV
jgi:myo-inositol catabolism protein IolS